MKIKPHLLLLGLLALLSVEKAQATVSFDLEAEQLRTSLGVAESTSALWVLVADNSSNGFGNVSTGASLTVGSFLNGSDDQILAKGDLSANGVAGALLANPAGITVAQNTPLALYWFPDLTTSSSTASGGSTYGRYTNASTVAADGSSAWIAPANNTTGYALHFFTTSATTFHTGGTNTAASGNASLTVAAAPEPSRMMLMGLGLGAFFLRRRRMA